jgi:hypothetical protein
VNKPQIFVRFQATLFRIFQQVFHAPKTPHSEELRRFAIFIVREFLKMATNNPKIYAELLFFKSLRETYMIEHGYEDQYEHTGGKVQWTEEQENELRCLFMENQANPTTDKGKSSVALIFHFIFIRAERQKIENKFQLTIFLFQFMGKL